MKDILSKEWSNHVEDTNCEDDIRDVSRVSYYAGVYVMLSNMTKHGIADTEVGKELMDDLLEELDELSGDYK